MTANLCVLDHDDPKQPAHPLAVCAWHRGRIEQAVAETPAYYLALTGQLAPTGSGSNTGPTSGSKDVGIDIQPRVAQLRTDIRNTISTWARVAIDQRGMTGPTDTVPAICAWLVKQIDWYLAQPWTRQFANDMTENTTEARRILFPSGDRRIHIKDHTCPEPGCTGTLTTRLRREGSLLPAWIECDDSPTDDDGTLLHWWPADKWMTLGRAIMRKETA